MAENVLRAKIEGDIKDLEAKLTKADKLLKQYENNIKSVQDAISKNTKGSQQLEKQLDSLNQSYSKGEIGQEKYERETKRLTSSFQKSQQKTRDFQRELKRLEREYTRTSNSSKKLNKDVKDYPKSVDKATNSTKGFKKGTANANATLTSFSRVVQDAPYGIQGVSNNIQDLTSQFGYLKNKTGSTKGALKALAQDLTGAGGVLLAVSLVTAAMTAFSNGSLSLNSIFASLGSSSAKAAEKVKAFGNALAESRASIQTEIVSLKELVRIAGDENESRERRNQAVKILQSKYPDYLQNLTTENIKNNDIVDSINNITNALERKAKVQAAEQIVTEKAQDLFKAQVEAEEDFIKRRNLALQGAENILNFEIDPNNLDKLSREQALAVGKLVGNSIGEARDTQRKALKKSEEDYKGYVDNLKDIISSTPDLFDIFDSGSSSGSSDKAKEKLMTLEEILAESERMTKESAEERLKINQDFYDTLADYQQDVDNFKGIDDGFYKAYDTLLQFEEAVKRVQKVLGEGFGGEGFDLAGLEAFENKLYTNMEVAELWSGALNSSIQSVAGQLSSYLETGNEVIDAFISTLIRGVAQVAASLLQQKILDGVATQAKVAAERTKSQANAITIATNAAAAAGPLGIGLLPGFIASQTALVQGAFSGLQLQSFNDGGFVSGGSFNGDSTLIRANAGELVLNNQQQRRMFSMLDNGAGNVSSTPSRIEIFGNIKGRDINLSNKRYNDKLSRRI